MTFRYMNWQNKYKLVSTKNAYKTHEKCKIGTCRMCTESLRIMYQRLDVIQSTKGWTIYSILPKVLGHSSKGDHGVGVIILYFRGWAWPLSSSERNC